jgi:hypothetical protein
MAFTQIVLASSVQGEGQASSSGRMVREGVNPMGIKEGDYA